MATAALTNGSAPETPEVVERPLDRIRRETSEQLDSLLAPLRARRSQLEAELRDVTREEEEVKAVVAALGVKAPKKKPSQLSATHGPSQKMQDDVYAFIAQRAKAGSPDTIKDEVCEGLGISQSTAMDALRALRETERIRIVGTRKADNDTRTGGRAPSAYAVMPDE